jgi:stalled ribosome alternative rescue factor ArfA
MKSRNHVARNAWKFNKAKIYKAKKGKGSFKRVKNARSLFLDSDLRLAG